jgi:putative SOS response-associated peptidase YedK
MCGHYTYRHTWADIVALYRLTGSPVPPNEFRPRYNLAPTPQGPVVRQREEDRELVMLRWGLIPLLG